MIKVTTTTWKRPESVPFPSVWLEFEGKKEINGVKQKFWIQDLTDEWMDEFLFYLAHGLFQDEPLCKHLNLNEKETMEEAMVVWKNYIKHKLSVICLTKDANGKIKFAGLNVLTRSAEDDEELTAKSPKLKILFNVMGLVVSQKNSFKELGIHEYLGAFGLFVLPEFRGQSLGGELLKARIPLCKAMGFKATLTSFSSFISQKLAARCGFYNFSVMDYDEIFRLHPEWTIHGITNHTKDLKYMCMEI